MEKKSENYITVSCFKYCLKTKNKRTWLKIPLCTEAHPSKNSYCRVHLPIIQVQNRNVETPLRVTL